MSKTTAPTAPATPAAKVTAQPCRCGCKAQTVRPEALYLPGHDARHAGQVGRALIADPTKAATLLKTLPTPALRTKAEGMVKTAQAKVAKKAAGAEARKAAQAAAKAAYDAAIKAAGL